MAFFELNSKVTIGQYSFTDGIGDILIKRSIRSYVDMATIKVPHEAIVERNGKIDPTLQAVGELINDGDTVSIYLGYNGNLNLEFQGFVKRRSFGMPLEIECEGYSWQLRHNVSVNAFFSATTVKDLLSIAIGATDATGAQLKPGLTDCSLVCEVDVPLQNLTFPNYSGTQIIDEIKKICQGTLSIFFIEPTVLWCGLAYSSYQANSDPFGNGATSYRVGWNCLKDNNLKERTVTDPVQVFFSGTLATGQRLVTKSENDAAKRKDKAIMNNVPSIQAMKKLANEKQFQANYIGFEGSLTGFLEPICTPGYKVILTDDDYKELNGTYMAESVSVSFGQNGGRRVVELGPQIGFKTR